jgi:uncharacterized protein
MNKKQELQKALTTAMKARDEDTKRTLRLLLSAVKMAEIDEGKALSDERILNIIQKEIKTREDALDEAKKANRPDLIEAACKEKEILNRFLPQQMSTEELETLAKRVIDEVGAESIRDMGRVMKALMPELKGRASGQDASKVVKALLT